jgi:hypothetical protein
MGYLKKVNPNDIIAIVSFPMDKEVPTYNKPNGMIDSTFHLFGFYINIYIMKIRHNYS